MMKNHIATYSLGLAHEGWSESQKYEDELLTNIAVENKKRRDAVQDRKGAEKMLRDAKAKAEERERAWATRQEEARRYTNEQRAWWDVEIHHKHSDSTINHEQLELVQKQQERSAKLEREAKGIFKYEKAMREQRLASHAEHGLAVPAAGATPRNILDAVRRASAVAEKALAWQRGLPVREVYDAQYAALAAAERAAA